jgi:glycosyltransferase involved in cell wall biosynthesis
MISIIVPVYNSASTLSKCIESLLAQTYPDLEILLIDDGSKDTSGTICDMYTSQDARIRTYHKVNRGGGKFCTQFGNNTSKRRVYYIL